LDELLIPVLRRWIDGQERLVLGSVTRSIKADNFTAAYENVHFTSSVMDIATILNISTDFLCSLNIPNTLSWSLPLLADVIGKAVIKYYEDARQFPFNFYDSSLSNFRRPIHWLRQSSDNRESELSSGELDIATLVRERKLAITEKASAHELELLASKGKTKELCRLAFNSRYLYEQSKKLEGLILNTCDKYALLQEQRRDMIRHPFEEVEQACQHYIIDTSAYMARYIIFIELRHAFAYELYRIPMEDSRITFLLVELDRILSSVHSQLSDDHEFLKNLLIMTLRYFMEFFEMVILDGGPDRLFHEGDADLLLEDLGCIEKFFCQTYGEHHNNDHYRMDSQGKWWYLIILRREILWWNGGFFFRSCINWVLYRY
jgi:hypothetical protein